MRTVVTCNPIKTTHDYNWTLDFVGTFLNAVNNEARFVTADLTRFVSDYIDTYNYNPTGSVTSYNVEQSGRKLICLSI